MTITMAFAVSTPSTSLLHSSSSCSSGGGKTSFLCTFSNSSFSIPKNAIPQLGFTTFSQWNGLKHLRLSISHYSARMKKKGKRRGKGVYASLFGVGAPEALVIGVVALLVFGPKGLAEVARNLGKTLRAFQPTIRELQEVSREFKSTLEREIGLDDIDNPVPKSSGSKAAKPTPEDPETSVEPNGSPSEAGESSADSYLKVSEVKLMGALAQLQKEQTEEKEKAQLQAETTTLSQDNQALDTRQEAASSVTPPSQSPEGNSHEEDAPVPATKLESET